MKQSLLKVIMAGAIITASSYGSNEQITNRVAVEHMVIEEGLSEARYAISSTSVGDYAIFTGGYANISKDTVDIFKKEGNKIVKVETDLKLSVGRKYISATSVGDFAIFAGGMDTDYKNTVDVFKREGNKIVKVDVDLKLSVDRMSLAAANIGPYAIFAGGISRNNIYKDTIDIFQVKADGTIERVVINDSDGTPLALKQPRRNLASATIGDYAIFAGGYGDYYNNKDTVDIFKFENGKIVRVEHSLKLRIPRTSLSAASVGNYAIFAGGYGDYGIYGEIDIFKLEVGQIVKVAINPGIMKLSEYRCLLSATSVGNYVFFASGWGDGGLYSDVVDIFKLQAGELVKVNWLDKEINSDDESGLTLSIAKSWSSATSVEDFAIFAGGYDATYNENKMVDVFRVNRFDS